MFKLTQCFFCPDKDGMQIMQMLAKGFRQPKIAIALKIRHGAIRQRLNQLRINLGVNTNEQMVHEFTKFTLLNHLKQFAANENSEAIELIKKYCSERLPHIEAFEKAMEAKIEKLADK